MKNASMRISCKLCVCACAAHWKYELNSHFSIFKSHPVFVLVFTILMIIFFRSSSEIWAILLCVVFKFSTRIKENCFTQLNRRKKVNFVEWLKSVFLLLMNQYEWSKYLYNSTSRYSRNKSRNKKRWKTFFWLLRSEWNLFIWFEHHFTVCMRTNESTRTDIQHSTVGFEVSIQRDIKTHEHTFTQTVHVYERASIERLCWSLRNRLLSLFCSSHKCVN